MSQVNFLQIHSLHGYSAALLNRDDSGLAKRMMYGGALRTRISSQCLKRHWRTTDNEHSLKGIDGATAGVRSREIVTRKVIDPLNKNTDYSEDVIKRIDKYFQTAVYGDKGETRDKRQPLLLGQPEIDYLAAEAKSIADSCNDNAEQAEGVLKEWKASIRQNLKTMRENCKLPGSLAAALFGRMVTSDVEANIDAAVHVAHSITVHEEESESDYFTVVDDLQRVEDDAGADHIGETELTSGLFYGYVVLDIRMLLNNLGGDTEIAKDVIKRLVHLIATVSPGAKLGSTAPYNYANWMLVEAGNRQPRSLAEAFRKPCASLVDKAARAVNDHVRQLDKIYGREEERRLMSLTEQKIKGAKAVSLPELASWASNVLQNGAD